MNFLAPMALALLSLLPLVLLLYFLKLKRQDVLVSSTFLWRKTVQDLRVNSPFQRLRKNLLLWLQLLLLALLILGLARPILDMSGGGGKRYICLIDTSASMTAADVRPTRMAKARDEARRLIGDMNRHDQMMLISFDVRPSVVVPFTGVKSRLREALETIKARETRTDYARAIDLVQSLTQDMEEVELFLFSDGAYEEYVPRRMGAVSMNYVKIGAACDNVGITAIDARRSLENWEEPQVFARLQNFGPMPREVRVDLYLNDLLFDACTVTVPAGQTAPAVFSDPNLREGLVRIALNVEDDLAVDNTAWLHLIEPKEATTLVVTAGNYFLELAARKDPLCAPAFMSPKEYDAALAAGTLENHDLVVFDRHTPDTLPPRRLPLPRRPRRPWRASPLPARRSNPR